MLKTPTSPNPEAAAAFETCLEKQLDLCRRLEELADSLPSKFDAQEATRLANQLVTTLQRSHALEENVIFPALERKNAEMSRIFNRLRHEHREDEDHASDVRDSVGAFIMARNKEDAEKLGYMLRCLFTSLRRHLAFERDYVLPLFRRTLAL